MGPDEKDTGKIAIYEEPDGTLVGIMDGEIQEIYPGEERPGVYLEGEAIDDIREKAGEICHVYGGQGQPQARGVL